MFLSFKVRRFLLTATSLAAICLSVLPAFTQTPFDSAQLNLGIDPRFADAAIWQQRPNRLPNQESAVGQLAAPNENRLLLAAQLDAAFAPQIDFSPGSGSSAALQADGKILVGGFFKNINGSTARNIVRLNQDYSIDSTFNAATNGTVLAIAVQPDGKILIGGLFTNVNGATRNRIARLNSDGSLDANFNPGADNIVYDIELQADGKILLGGVFFGVNAAGSHAIARLNADGSVDGSFASPYSIIPPTAPGGNFTTSTIINIATQPDGKILIAGDVYTPNGSTTTRRALVRLNQNGAIDQSFAAPNVIQGRAVAVQSTGKILFGGFFTTVNGAARNGIARFNPDGSHDISFNAANNVNILTNSIVVLPNDSMFVGGSALLVGGAVGSSVLRLTPDGARDTSFAPSNAPSRLVSAVLPLSNNRVLITSSITATNAENRNTIAVFNSDGTLDAAAGFSAIATGIVRALARQADGKILAGGNFTNVNNVSQSFLTRFNADGSLDADFVVNGVNITGTVTALLASPDGKILVGGTSLVVNNTARRIVRLNPNGSIDDSFVQGTIANIGSPIEFALQADNKILVVYRAASTSVLFPRYGIARLNADGSPDSSFANSGNSLPFESIAVQPDGKILVGGPFSIVYSGSSTPPDSYRGIIRLNSDGTHDRDFRPATSNADNQFSSVYAISVRPDGKVLIGGNITPNGASSSVAMLRLNANGTRDTSFNLATISNSANADRVEDFVVQPNNKIVIGGTFSTIDGLARQNVARLNANGSLDTGFSANANDAVYDVESQSNNRVLLGGAFDTVNNQPRTALARLRAGATLFDFDGDARADLSVFRPSEGNWYLLRSANNALGTANWGVASDKLAPADYDGDGKTDFAVWRAEPANPERANFYILNSLDNTVRVEQFGRTGDVPISGDWDADGRADLAVYRAGANNSQSRFFYRPSSQPAIDFVALDFGLGGDKPVTGDYDADGKLDAAVFRPADGTWYIRQSSNGTVRFESWGLSQDKLVPADYDGDAKTDVAVFRDGIWYIKQSAFSDQPRYEQFGLTGDAPVPADYDGDARADVAIWRPSTAVWWMQQSQNGATVQQWGSVGDAPIPAAILP